MEPMNQSPTLAELAADSGLNQAGVALFSGLSTSTISRLWADPNWLTRASGSTLMRLTASVPGVEHYIRSLLLWVVRTSTAVGGLARVLRPGGGPD